MGANNSLLNPNSDDYDKASVDEANSPDADNLKSEKGKTKKKKMTKKESQTRLKDESFSVIHEDETSDTKKPQTKLPKRLLSMAKAPPNFRRRPKNDAKAGEGLPEDELDETVQKVSGSGKYLRENPDLMELQQKNEDRLKASRREQITEDRD
ncbi:uncharacterized protein LOC134855773 [Symsagittifera roscoffensis]|uniref:uncharacterized protein LOC134855773 n=1 Tax=Symsagittifera roscoffensis TaxID=84072 RepID=UPI00307BA060